MPAPKLVYEVVADRLRGQILAGKLRAGHKLPTEAELGRQFKVGRSTIREALRMLTSERLLSTTRGVGGGSTVAHLDHDDLTEILESTIAVLTQSRAVSVAELLEARELLEVPAVRLAAKRGTAAQLEKVHSTIPASLKGMPPSRIFQVNRAFHEALLDAAGNRLLRAMTAPVFTVIGNRFDRERADHEFWSVSMAEHRKIFKAVEAGEPEQAAHEMQKHLLHLRATYEAIDSITKRR